MRKLFKPFISLLLAAVTLLSVGMLSYAVSSFTTKSQFNARTYTHYSAFSGTAVKDMIDVSEHNGLINFYKIKALGIDDVIIRVGFRGYGASGSLGEDKYFYDNMENAIDAGINVGLYFYSQALTTAEAKTEAEFCIKRAAQYKKYINLPIFFDYEFAGVSSGRLDKAWNNGTLNQTKMTNNTVAFCDTIREAGYKTGVYASASFFTVQLNADKLHKNGYEIWNAYYTTNSTSGSYWTNKNPVYRYWQYGGANVQGSCGEPTTAWLKVKYGSNTGYVIASSIDFTGAASGFSIADGLNLRKGAGTSYGVVTQIPFAGKVNILSYPTNTQTDVNFYYYQTAQKEPAKPQFALSATSSDTVKISWKSVSGASFYRVYSYDKQSGKYARLAQTTGTSYTNSGLEKEREYTYLVRAFYNAEHGSAYSLSDNKCVITAPAKPVFSLSEGSTSVKLSWKTVENAAYYRVYLYKGNNSYQRMAQVKTTSYTCTVPEPETEYAFLVRAFFEDGVGSAFSTADNKSVTTAPACPQAECVKKTANSLTLQWKKAKTAAYYRVYTFDAASGKYTRVGQTKENRFVLNALASGTKYTVLVRAFHANGCGSDYTAADHMAVQTLPAAPSARFIRYSYSIKLEWNAVKGAAFYRVYSYNKTTGKYTRLAQTETASWQHDGLKGNTEYTYLVRAFEDNVNGSAYSSKNHQSVKTLLRKPPFKLTATADNRISVSWSKVAGASYYRVYLYNAETGKYTRLAQTSALSFVYEKAEPESEYVFLVRAFSKAGEGSSYSAANHQSIVLKMEKAVFHAESTVQGSVTLFWKKVANAAFYRIYSFDALTRQYTRLAQTEQLSYTLKGLESGKEYHFLVRAFSSSGKASAYEVSDNQSIEVL